jgi:hypothetical protein
LESNTMYEGLLKLTVVAGPKSPLKPAEELPAERTPLCTMVSAWGRAKGAPTRKARIARTMKDKRPQRRFENMRELLRQ